MKLHVTVLLIAFLSLAFLVFNDCVFTAIKLEQQSRACFKAFIAKRFIAESFRNSCKGEGFDSLEEWQECCKSLFNLEEINWKSVDEQNLINEEELMYGSWQSSSEEIDFSGEVYYRKRRSLD